MHQLQVCFAYSMKVWEVSQYFHMLWFTEVIPHAMQVLVAALTAYKPSLQTACERLSFACCLWPLLVTTTLACTQMSKT